MLFILHSITSVETRVKTFLLVSFELVFFERDTHTHTHTQKKKRIKHLSKKRDFEINKQQEYACWQRKRKDVCVENK